MSPLGVGTSRSTYTLKTGEAKLWVFLVGVNQYQDEHLSSLRYSALDCQGLSEALVKATQGFPNKEVMTHHDFAAQRPESETVRANLQQIISQTQSQDTILFYFSGHGVLEPNTQQAILCLADTRKDNLLATGLGVQELLQMLDTSSAHQQLICLDTCHSGNMMPRGARAAIAGQRNSSSSLLNPTAQLVQVLRQRAAQSKGFCALLSCDQGQQSWEFPELRHGVFTYYLIRGLLGEAADSQGVIEADGLYKYVYHQTLQYINKTNQQLRLINQQKRSRGETQLHPEYPVQTPKRIVEGVGELILGLKPAIASDEPRRQGLFVEGLSSSKTSLALSQVLSEAGGFELEYWPQAGKTWPEVRGAIQACLRHTTSKRESLTSFPATEEIVTALLYLRGRIEEIEDGEAWLVLGDEVRLSRSWLRQELRRSGIAQQIVVLDCPGTSSLSDWVEDLQIGSDQGQCLIAAAATTAEPELFSQALLETLVAADLQQGLPVAEWAAQLQLTLVETGIPLHIWLSGGTQGVIEILPGNIASVLPITQLRHHPCSLIPNKDHTSAMDDGPEELSNLAQASSVAGSRHHSLTPEFPQSLNRTESDPNLVLNSEQYSQIEQLLMKLVGPIAPTLLRKVSAQASSSQEVIDSLALNLSQQQRLEFEQRAISLIQESIQPQTKSCNSLDLKHEPINDSLLRQCERELADLVGPIASFLIQKALETHPQISLTELVNMLAANFSDPQKALKFQQRLLS